MRTHWPLVFFSISLASCLSAGAQQSSPERDFALAKAHFHAGEQRWVRLALSVCKTPEAVWQIDENACSRVTGPLTVGEARPAGNGDPGLIYVVTTKNGRTGYVSEVDLDDFSLSTANRAKSVAEKAACDRKGGVRIGMTRAQVDSSCWGPPISVSTTATARNRLDQLVYANQGYVYLRNGVVYAVQVSR